MADWQYSAAALRAMADVHGALFGWTPRIPDPFPLLRQQSQQSSEDTRQHAAAGLGHSWWNAGMTVTRQYHGCTVRPTSLETGRLVDDSLLLACMRQQQQPVLRGLLLSL